MNQMELACEQECQTLRAELEESEARRRYLEMIVLDALEKESEHDIDNKLWNQKMDKLREQLMMGSSLRSNPNSSRRASGNNSPLLASSIGILLSARSHNN